MKRDSLTLAYLSAVANAAIIGFSFLFVKVALGHAAAFDVLAWRFVASFAVMTVGVVLGRVRLDYRGKPLGKALLLATMYPLGFFALQTFGLRHATSAEGGILFAFTPIVTMLLASAFLGEATTALQKASISLSVAGVLLIFAMKGARIDLANLGGLALLSLSCLAVAGYSVLARSLLRVFAPAEITYLMLGIGFVSFLAAALAGHAADGTLDRALAPLASGAFVGSVLYLGVLSSLVTALASNYVLSRMEASRASVFGSLSTVVSVVAGATFLGERITGYHVAGSALVILGVLGANRLRRAPAPRRVLGADRAKA